MPATARETLETAVDQIRKVGRPDPDTRFLVLKHDEDAWGRNVLHLRLTIPLVFPSDYFSLDEFRDFAKENPASKR